MIGQTIYQPDRSNHNEGTNSKNGIGFQKDRQVHPQKSIPNAEHRSPPGQNSTRGKIRYEKSNIIFNNSLTIRTLANSIG